MPVSSKEHAKQCACALFAQKRLRLTAQRRAIIDTVLDTNQHFTADELLAWSRAKDPSVSRATVYRTLPLLAESGLVREMDLGKDRKYYDPNYGTRPHHSHIVCEDCHQMFEFESEAIEALVTQTAAELGFEARTQQLQITARCLELRRQGYCQHKIPAR